MYDYALRNPISRKYRSYRTSRIELLERRNLLTGMPPTVVDIEIASTSWAPAFVEYLDTASLGTNGYSIPVGSAAQYASLTWTGIDKIIITFSKDVHVDSADLSLSGVNTTAYSFSAFRYDPMSYVATWTLSTPLDKDRLQLDLSADGLDPVEDQNGNILDGEWTNKVSTVSGNGTAGGDFQFIFHVQPADVNNTGNVSSTDSGQINQLSGKSTTTAGYVAARDLNGSGLIDSTDYQEAVDRYFEERPFGSPAGVSNDAPTTKGLGLVQITNTSIDHAITLLSEFDDAESGGNGLTYSIVSNSNSPLFDTLSINPTTKSLVANAANGASGRASLLIRATDGAGLFTETPITIDVNRQNQAPELEFHISPYAYNTWIVSGSVTDPDDDVSQFIVGFYGEFNVRCAVDEEGNFYFAIILDPDDLDVEYGITIDPHGLPSLEVYQELWPS